MAASPRSIPSAQALYLWFNAPASVASLAPFAPDGFVSALHAPGYLPRGFPDAAKWQMIACARRLVEHLTELAGGRADAEEEILRIMSQLEELRQAHGFRLIPAGTPGEALDYRELTVGHVYDSRGFPTPKGHLARVIVPFPDRSP